MRTSLRSGLTISIIVFERLRGYRVAVRAGELLHPQQQAFEALVQTCLVLSFDDAAADVASTTWCFWRSPPA